MRALETVKSHLMRLQALVAWSITPGHDPHVNVDYIWTLVLAALPSGLKRAAEHNLAYRHVLDTTAAGLRGARHFLPRRRLHHL